MKRKKKLTRPKPLKNPRPRPHRYYPKADFANMKPREKLEKTWSNDWMTVKAMRRFVKGFDAADGYNLNDIYNGRIHSSMKAKIRRYREYFTPEIVAINSNHAVVKTYRSKATLEAAVEASQQFAPMAKMQKSAVFYTKYPDEFKVKLTRKRGKPNFEMYDGLNRMTRVLFESQEFMDELDAWYGKPVDWLEVLANDPDVIAEVAQILLPESNRFSVLTGKYSTAPIASGDFGGWFANWIMKYADDDGEFMVDFDDFLMGVQAMH